MRASRAIVFCAVFVCAAISLPSPSKAQTAVVKANANLRAGPSASQAAIRLLLPGEQLQVLSLTAVNSYYNVATAQSEQGWVYGPRIEIDASTISGTVERNTNLRSGPSSATSIIRLLTPGEVVTVLSSTPTTSYYNVRTTANEVGWAYQPNITIASTPPTPTPTPATPFPDARNAPPADWAGPVFKLSQNYPASPPAAETQPWKAFNFQTQAQAAQYLAAVYAYARDGNVQVDWRGDQNAVRKWYHAPWLHVGPAGREYVHGLTRERTSRPGELHSLQLSSWKSYAVGLYNPAGGYITGQVWKDHENPNPSAAQFPDGAVAVKLLFTTAPVSEVPYLANSLEWDGHISLVGSEARAIRKVRLLQIDLAVRDSRANATTGWVFGTYIYDGTSAGATVWDRMKPVGLMWGNDPTLVPGGGSPTQSIILNPIVAGHTLKLGWAGRLNGPVDNPNSTCLACHGTAQDPYVANFEPTGTNMQRLNWFRNLGPGTPFTSGGTALDYSLQLSVGIRNLFSSRGPSPR